MDTKLATQKGNKLILLFSKELTILDKQQLLNNIQRVKNETTAVWNYKKINNELFLIDSNNPTFTSKYLAAKHLKLSQRTINKYLDTHKEYKGLFFYSYAI